VTGDTSGIDFNSDLEGTCPCGKKFFVDCENYAVIHDLPMCEPFRLLDPHEFLHYVRVAITGIADN
jgi:hypothetical protein